MTSDAMGNGKTSDDQGMLAIKTIPKTTHSILLYNR